jgi:hypothetical protein
MLSFFLIFHFAGLVPRPILTIRRPSEDDDDSPCLFVHNNNVRSGRFREWCLFLNQVIAVALKILDL